MDKSHEPFIELVKSNDHLGKDNSRKYSESQLREFLDGQLKDPLLSTCFQYWSRGDTGKVAQILKGKDTKSED
jgi:hypothetical protein